MLVTSKINSSNIVFDVMYTHSVREYYLYCVKLFKEVLQDHDIPVNIIFGDFDYDFANGLPTKRVAFQYEHTLVKPGGRDSAGFPAGIVPVDDQSFYLVRLSNYGLIEKSSLVVDYSLSNIYNVANTVFYPHYNARNLHVAACLYDIDFGRNRMLDVSTNFYDTNQPRRSKLLKLLQKVGVGNHTGIYGERLANLYRSTKVLVNVHQTDHHDTLEELRVLPALRRGAIVVAEHSALEQWVPYKDHIIWANYDEIPGVVEEVLDNYDRHRERIFNDSLRGIFKELEQSNIAQVSRSLTWLR